MSHPDNTIPAHIFRAYDIRGEVPNELHPQLLFTLGQALATRAAALGLHRFVLGRDGRHSSPELAEALARGLVASGAQVLDVGLCPTPLVYFAAMRDDQQCGVMLTGSHNPPAYNGCKMILGGEAVAGEDIATLRQLMQSGVFRQSSGSHTRLDCEEDYITAVLNNCQPLARPLKLVVDAGNGATGELGPQLFRRMGCEVIELFCEIDGNFPNHHPDPGKLENLRDLQAKLAECDADIGFAFDGDGDRLGVVTNLGKVVFPDRVLVLFAEDLLARHPGATVLMDVKCSPLVHKQIAAYGGKPELCATGHSLIKRAMRRTGALLAGEMSGHMFFAEDWNGCDDALLAGARLLSLLSRFAGSSSQLFARFPAWQGTPEINLITSDARKWDIVEALRREGQFGQARLIDIDGIRVEYPDCWGLVRCSNTTPALVLRFEGANTAALQRIVASFIDQLGALAPELDLAPLRSATPCASTPL